MEIGRINSVLYRPKSLYDRSLQFNAHNNTVNSENKPFEFPSYNFYNTLAFSGGKSMNLAETKMQLDKYSAYPSKGLKDEISEIVSNGNSDKKLLLDVHKQYYSLLKSCEDVSDTAIYDEFKGVLSDKDVKYNKGSFIDKVKNNEIEGFDPDEDVSLQLIQLYWGEGFSLNALEKEYGQNITGVFDKLHIPTVPKVYGQYLKLSDKEYNDKFSAFMSERAKEIERKKSEKKSGNKTENNAEHSKTTIQEPTTPLNNEQKKFIRNGIQRQSVENPDEIAEIVSKRKKFFEENPEESERFSQVLLRAWNYKEANPIKKRMSSFMKKSYDTDNDSLINDTKNNKNFKDFWLKNPWAKKQFSSCMRKSWARQNELTLMGLIYEPLYTSSYMPKSMLKEMSKMTGNSDFEKGFQYIIKDPREKDKIENQPKVYTRPAIMLKILPKETTGKNYISQMDKFNDYYNNWKLSLVCGISKTISQCQKSGKNIDEYKKFMLDCYEAKEHNIEISPIYLYSQLIEICKKNGDIDIIRDVDKNMNKMFDNMKDKKPYEAFNYIMKEVQDITGMQIELLPL